MAESSGGTRGKFFEQKKLQILENKVLENSDKNMMFTLDEGGDTESEYSTIKGGTFGTFGLGSQNRNNINPSVHNRLRD